MSYRAPLPKGPIDPQFKERKATAIEEKQQRIKAAQNFKKNDRIELSDRRQALVSEVDYAQGRLKVRVGKMKPFGWSPLEATKLS